MSDGEEYDIYIAYDEEERIPLNAKIKKCPKPKCSNCTFYWHTEADQYRNYPTDGDDNGVVWVRVKRTPERDDVLKNFLYWWKEERDNLKKDGEWKVDKCTIPFHAHWTEKKADQCQFYHEHLNDRVVKQQKLTLTELEDWCGLKANGLTDEERWSRVDRLQEVVKAIVAAKIQN